MRLRENDQATRGRQAPTPRVPISFEMFPPRTEKGRTKLDETVSQLAGVATAGFSVTMGAGGSAKGGTLETAKSIADSTGRSVKPHLIAVGHSRQAVIEEADDFRRAGITRILALRGDLPHGSAGRAKGEFRHASDLVAALSARHDFEISVAAYPEKHPEAASLEVDIDHLKRKIDAGAAAAICQFVLNTGAYARFLDACARRGVTVPIIPGVMPIENWPRVRAFAEANGTSIPEDLDRLFADVSDPDERPRVSAALLAGQARQLLAYGAPGLHVYALNRWELPLALINDLQRANRP